MYKYEIDLKGRIFGRLTVIKRIDKENWSCKCNCGTKDVRVRCYSLFNGNTTSCGCYVKEQVKIATKAAKSVNTKHGLWKHPITKKHSSMISRCYNTSDDSYSNYGGRGIKVCKRWRNTEKGIQNFISDMLPTYFEGAEIDRYPDNNGDYSPSNCRWTTRRNNVNNRKVTRFITIEGIKYPITEAAEKFGIGSKTILYRLNLGWPDEDCITPPYQKRTELDVSLDRNKKKGRPKT